MEELHDYFYNIFFDENGDYEGKPEIFILEMTKDSNLFSFGRHLDKLNFCYKNDSLLNKYKDHLVKIDDYLYSSFDKFQDDELGEKIKQHVLSVVPEELQDDHILYAHPYGYGMVKVKTCKISDIDLRYNQVEEYLMKYGIELNKDNVYTFQMFYELEARMHWVKVNGQTINYGNTWDFHNGCNGCKIPSYNGASSYISVLARGLKSKGYKVEILDPVAGKSDEA